jgi:hypothetical protein
MPRYAELSVDVVVFVCLSVFLFVLLLFYFSGFLYKSIYGGAVYLNFTGQLNDKDVFVGDVFTSLEVWGCFL